jgi:pheromone shutdown protein TraB
MRRETLDTLKEKRKKIAKQFSAHQGVLSTELDKDAFDEVYDAITQMVRNLPDIFPNLQKALVEYRHRSDTMP